MIVGLLKNQNIDSVLKWELACRKERVSYRIIDLTNNTWLEEISSERFDFFVVRPPGDIASFKQLYDERLYIISEILNLNIFPSFKECFIYENKRLLSYFLKAYSIPHPVTNVFYDYKEVINFIQINDFPLVVKSNIGAAGSGVKILSTRSEALNYIKRAFRGKGVTRRFGPNRVTGTPGKWFKKALRDPGYFINRLKSYLERQKDTQSGFVIFQKYISHEFEWRVARIGDSYFAYKKFKVGDKASGAKSLGFANPPLDLLEFVKKISDKAGINCAAFDLFPTPDGYLVNEIQTIFGHKNDHILEIDGKKGRYKYSLNKWIFEEGDFNTNESFDLRLQTAIRLFGK